MCRLPYCQLLICLMLASCGPNLSDDEKVKHFFCEKKGYACTNLDDICLYRPNKLKNVIVLGTFAHDKGCICESIIVNDHMGDWQHMLGAALLANGWGQPDQRKELLANLLNEMSMGFGGVIQTNTTIEQPDEPPIHQPIYELSEDEVKATFWVKEEAGMTRAVTYHQYTIAFNSKAELTNYELTGEFSYSLDEVDADTQPQANDTTENDTKQVPPIQIIDKPDPQPTDDYIRDPMDDPNYVGTTCKFDETGKCIEHIHKNIEEDVKEPMYFKDPRKDPNYVGTPCKFDETGKCIEHNHKSK